MSIKKPYYSCYRYHLVHPVADQMLEINLYDDQTKELWEPYIEHIQKWLVEQRIKANPPL